MPPWSPSAAFCQLGPLNDRRGWDIDPSRFTDEWWADTAQRWTVTDSSHQMGHVGLVEVNGGTVHVDDITLRVVPLPNRQVDSPTARRGAAFGRPLYMSDPGRF